jgi:GTP cyclohydrolase I
VGVLLPLRGVYLGAGALKEPDVSSIQDGRDDREIALERVGVTGLAYPVMVPDGRGGKRTADARLGLFVGLSRESRGVHMSRLVETLHARSDVTLDRRGIGFLLRDLRDALDAPSSFLDLAYTDYVERTAPLSGAASLLACAVRVSASLAEGDNEPDLELTVRAPVLAVCPCSMETAGGAAHSQRGHVTVSVRYVGRVLLEEIVAMIDDSASGPVLPLLKSDDERAIMEEAHGRPVFVEDLARNLAERLDSDVRIHWYRVEAENLESVHDHNAYACVERSR